MSKPVKEEHSVCANSSGTDAYCNWRALFQKRYLRQKEWDKRRQKRGGADRKASDDLKDGKPAKSDGKFHPSGHAKMTRGRENGKEKYHAPRLRTCKRCGVEFDPHQNGPDACTWHKGRYVPMDDN